MSEKNGNAPDRVRIFLPTRPGGNITIYFFGLTSYMWSGAGNQYNLTPIPKGYLNH